MFSGFTKQTSDFLWELSFNNERTWFAEHKSEFENCLKKPITELAHDTCGLMDSRYPEYGWSVHVSRIYRDARRLFGRGPFKERMWFTLTAAGSGDRCPALYFEIGAAAYRFGLGFHCASGSDMEEFRKGIASDPAAFSRIAEKIEKLNKYAIKGEDYKRAKGDMGPELNKWYNKKWLSLERSGDFGGDILSPDMPEILAAAFEELLPMYDFMRKTISAVPVPADGR